MIKTRLKHLTSNSLSLSWIPPQVPGEPSQFLLRSGVQTHIGWQVWFAIDEPGTPNSKLQTSI
jgi:hypothetical protein